MGELSTMLGETMPLPEKKLTKRGYLNRAGLEMWRAHPVLGVGIGNFGHYLIEPEYRPPTRVHERTVAHNVYVQAIAEFGTAGAIVVGWLVLGTIRNLAFAWRVRQRVPEQWCYFGAIEAMAVIVFITNMSSGNIMGQGFWAMLALAATTGNIARRELAENGGAVAAGSLGGTTPKAGGHG
jgi:O-antigen ligase